MHDRMLSERDYHGAAWLAMSVALFSFVVFASSCYSHGQTTCGQESSALAPLGGNVAVRVPAPPADAGAGTPDGGKTGTLPAAGSLVFVELCDLYSENPDPAKAHPNYRYVALADANGDFRIDVPKGTVGLHTLLEGYTYGSRLLDDSTASGVSVVAEPLGGRTPPEVSQLTVNPMTAAPGATLTFVMSVRAAPNDPISEEVLLAEPVSGTARAFAPPRRGKPGRGFPEGTWTATLNAPNVPGTYTYYGQAVSEQCAVSNRLAVEVTVR